MKNANKPHICIRTAKLSGTKYRGVEYGGSFYPVDSLSSESPVVHIAARLMHEAGNDQGYGTINTREQA